MSAKAPGDAKNAIRRIFTEIVDPSPSRAERLRIWEHFGHQCAYCGVPLIFDAKEAHLDHLVAASQGGANAIGNRVLSCAQCNAIEKLDTLWELFLTEKVPDDDVLEPRRNRILEWQAANPVPSEESTLQLRELAKAKAAEIVKALDTAVAELRQQKKALMP